MESRKPEHSQTGTCKTAIRRRSLPWMGACLLLLSGGTGTAYAQWDISQINVTNSAGASAGYIQVNGGGIDFSQSMGCPVNSNSYLVAGVLSGLIYYDTDNQPLPLNSTSGITWIDFDSYEDGGCNDPAVSSFTLTGAGFTLTVSPVEESESDSSYWGGTALLTLDSPSTLPATPVTGFIKPKYMIVGMYYVPPGMKSSAGYTSGFVNGTVTSSSTSYQNTESQSVSVTTGYSASVGAAKAAYKITASASGAWSQTTTDSQTLTVSQTQTTGYTLPGSSASKNGIDHGEDVVWVWLNPEVSLNFVQNIGVTINGYFFDPSDPAQGMDVVQLTVNELRNPSLIPTDLLSRLNRPWDPAGGPLNSADFQDILDTDPFVTNPAFDPETDTSGRYSDTQVIINYAPTDGSGQGQPSSMSYSVVSSSLKSNV